MKKTPTVRPPPEKEINNEYRIYTTYTKAINKAGNEVYHKRTKITPNKRYQNKLWKEEKERNRERINEICKKMKDNKINSHQIERIERILYEDP